MYVYLSVLTLFSRVLLVLCEGLCLHDLVQFLSNFYALAYHSSSMFKSSLLISYLVTSMYDILYVHFTSLFLSIKCSFYNHVLYIMASFLYKFSLSFCKFPIRWGAGVGKLSKRIKRLSNEEKYYFFPVEPKKLQKFLIANVHEEIEPGVHAHAWGRPMGPTLAHALGFSTRVCRAHREPLSYTPLEPLT